MDRPLVAGWACAVCGTSVDIAEPFSWKCPRAADGGPHALHLVEGRAPLASTGHPNPFLGFRRHLAADAFMAAHGLTDLAREAIVGYIHEMPVWKTSYRLILPEAPPSKTGGAASATDATMQGWAIVENTTDEDWILLAAQSRQPDRTTPTKDTR